MNKEYEALIEASNQHHNAVYDYLEAHGADELFQSLIYGEYRAAKFTAKRHGFDVSDRVNDIGRLF
jgi:hypothetical protein